jgi:hypothetical protein
VHPAERSHQNDYTDAKLHLKNVPVYKDFKATGTTKPVHY